MKKIIQKKITQIIQPEIAEYYCDKCGKRTGTVENKKETWSTVDDNKWVEKHYCKKTCSPRDHH